MICLGPRNWQGLRHSGRDCAAALMGGVVLSWELVALMRHSGRKRSYLNVAGTA